MSSPVTLKLSKKVAELTQVVHMLFVRNHEKETDLEQLKIAYEHEIDEIVFQYKEKIKQIENEVLAADVVRQNKEDDLRGKLEAEHWKRDTAEKEYSDKLAEERIQCQTSHDLLIGAEKDIERLKILHQEHLSNHEFVAESLRNEVNSLKQNNRNLETQITSEAESNVIKDLRKSQKHMNLENFELKKLLAESHSKQLDGVQKLKALQAELSSLKQRHNSISIANQDRRQAPLTSACFLDYQEESSRLRILVEKYRMELSNRENNFNRMFTQTQPIIVTRSNSANRNSATGRKYLPEVSRVRSTSACREIREEQLIKPRPPTQLFRRIIRR